MHAAFTRGVFERDWGNYYLLLDSGADIERTYRRGTTIAVTAAALGQPSKVLELLNRGYRRNLDELERIVAAREIVGNSSEESAKRDVLEFIQGLKKE